MAPSVKMLAYISLGPTRFLVALLFLRRENCFACLRGPCTRRAQAVAWDLKYEGMQLRFMARGGLLSLGLAPMLSVYHPPKNENQMKRNRKWHMQAGDIQVRPRAGVLSLSLKALACDWRKSAASQLWQNSTLTSRSTSRKTAMSGSSGRGSSRHHY